jgi:hypothetical protein
MIGVAYKATDLKTRADFVDTVRALVLDSRVKLEIDDSKRDVVILRLTGPSNPVLNKTKKILSALAIDHGGVLKLR